ncbi:hypothetical protein [Vibrio cholerae]|uniref:Uncharacterized protein n=1 Tax=Vibrio cholerae TaxID=666 RepID=A0ABD7SKN1_VIBCL|nr:hypothetical protein [Vibrio cholerae]TXX65354.1 hypothetical protein FXF03_12945 [Vibrio cholerae]GIA97768.1 Hypothetical protein VCSRO136_1918 [Vibrio cholerae]
MITVHRQYRVAGKPQLHAHVEVNPLGKLSVDVLETHQHHVAEFEQVKFEKQQGHVRIVSTNQKRPWQIALEAPDAQDLEHLMQDATNEYEQLMIDL